MDFSKWLRHGGALHIATAFVILVLLAGIFASSMWGAVEWPWWYSLPIALATNMSVILGAMIGSFADKEEDPDYNGDYYPFKFIGVLGWFLIALFLGIIICSNYLIWGIYSAALILLSLLLARLF